MRVRLICADERLEGERVMRAHHDRGRTALVGRSLRAVAERDGGWLALVGGATAALKLCPPRWRARLVADAARASGGGLIANNRRVLIRPGGRVKNRAARILDRPLARRSAAGQAAQGPRLLRAATFLDPGRGLGTCSRAATGIAGGAPRGWAKATDPSVAPGTSKRIWVVPLHRPARRIRSAPLPPPAFPRQAGHALTLTDADAAASGYAAGSHRRPARTHVRRADSRARYPPPATLTEP